MPILEQDLTTRNISINNLISEPPGLQRIRADITANTRTIVPVESSSPPDMLGEQLHHLLYAHSKPKELAISGGPRILVTGNEAELAQIDSWPGISKNIRIIPLNDITSVLNFDGIRQEFGAEISETDLEKASLLASMIIANIGADRNDSQAIISPDSGLEHPLLWLKWAEKKYGKQPLASQIAQFDSAREGLLYQSNTFRPYGPKACEVAEVLGEKKWLPSSQMVMLKDVAGEIPLASLNDIGRLVTALATAEIARNKNRPLYRLIVETHKPRETTFNISNEATKRMALALEILQTQLYMADREGNDGTRLGEATKRDLKRVNSKLQKYTGTAIIPSWNQLKAMGLTNSHALNKLRNKLSSHKFSGAELPTSRIEKPDFQLGPIPRWNPDDFAQLLETSQDYINRTKAKGAGAFEILRQNVWRIDGKSSRPYYSGMTQEYLPESFRQFYDLGVYNMPRYDGKSSEARAINLWTDEMASIREEVLQFLQNGDFIAATAFVDESDALKRVLDMANERIGKGRVVAADHCRNAASGEIARESGARVARFSENMKRINWKKLVDDGIIPQEILDENGVPMGLKGINTVNLLVELSDMEAEGAITDNTWIMLTDADIMNPGGNPEHAKEEWYDPFLYNGLAILDGEKKGLKLRAVHHAKTGIGRNNYNTHFMFDDMANSADPQIAQLGIILGTYVWPHTESRSYRWGALKQFLLAKDMQIEQTFDMCAAHMDLKEGSKRTAQVINPIPKIEDRKSHSKREWLMMTKIAHGVKETKTAAKRYGRLPMDMTLEDIGSTNKDFAARAHFQTVILDELHTSRQGQVALSDVLLPSWNMLKENGYIINKELLN